MNSIDKRHQINKRIKGNESFLSHGCSFETDITFIDCDQTNKNSIFEEFRNQAKQGQFDTR